jgi:23S rRNA (uracil1939-C5)-methyltransferase
MLNIGQQIQLEIQDLAFGGDGVGRYNNMAIFVPFTIPGEHITARITETKKNFARAEVVHLDQPSSLRIEAPCPYFTRCGGCQYQHISYAKELEFKVIQLHGLMKKIGKMENLETKPILFSEDYGYRNRITVHHDQGKIGFKDVSGREIVDIEKCLIAADEINVNLKKIRGDKPRWDHYSIRARGIPGEGFFQTNRYLIDQMLDAVKKAIDPSIEYAIEGYSGSGFFTKILSEQCKEVHAIEADPRSLVKARELKLSNTVFYEASVEEVLPEIFAELPEGKRLMFIDPPREGLAPIIIDTILDHDVDQLIYLSCDPATLARDLQRFSTKWKVDYLQPLDMFPQTAHLECLAVLSKI